LVQAVLLALMVRVTLLTQAVLVLAHLSALLSRPLVAVVVVAILHCVIEVVAAVVLAQVLVVLSTREHSV
jgi:hypothetical protein